MSTRRTRAQGASPSGFKELPIAPVRRARRQRLTAAAAAAASKSAASAVATPAVLPAVAASSPIAAPVEARRPQSPPNITSRSQSPHTTESRSASPPVAESRSTSPPVHRPTTRSQTRSASPEHNAIQQHKKELKRPTRVGSKKRARTQRGPSHYGDDTSDAEEAGQQRTAKRIRTQRGSSHYSVDTSENPSEQRLVKQGRTPKSHTLRGDDSDSEVGDASEQRLAKYVQSTSTGSPLKSRRILTPKLNRPSLPIQANSKESRTPIQTSLPPWQDILDPIARVERFEKEQRPLPSIQLQKRVLEDSLYNLNHPGPRRTPAQMIQDIESGVRSQERPRTEFFEEEEDDSELYNLATEPVTLEDLAEWTKNKQKIRKIDRDYRKCQDMSYAALEDGARASGSSLKFMNASADWLQADDSNLLPTAEEAKALLDQFKREKLARMAIVKTDASATAAPLHQSQIEPRRKSITSAASAQEQFVHQNEPEHSYDDVPLAEDNEFVTSDLEDSDSVDEEIGILSGEVEQEIPQAETPPQQPQPQPQPQAQESRGWPAFGTSIVSSLLSPFKFIGRHGHDAGSTPTTNKHAVARTATQTRYISHPPKTPTRTPSRRHKARPQTERRLRRGEKPPMHLRGVLTPAQIARRQQDDINAEARRKKREALVARVQEEEEAPSEENKDPCRLSESALKRMGIKARPGEKIYPNTFRVPDSSSDEDSEDEDEAVPITPSRNVSASSNSFSQPVQNFEQSSRNFEEFGDPHHARPYTGSLFQQPAYVQDNINEGKFPLTPCQEPSRLRSSQNIFDEDDRNNSLPRFVGQSDASSFSQRREIGQGTAPTFESPRDRGSPSAKWGSGGYSSGQPTPNVPDQFTYPSPSKAYTADQREKPLADSASDRVANNSSGDGTSVNKEKGKEQDPIPSTPAMDMTPLQQKKWTQTPPPKPRPSNATLPQPSAAEIKAREAAERHKPKNPSRLREVTQMSPLQIQEQEQENRTDWLNGLDTTFEDFDPMVIDYVYSIPDDQLAETIIPEEVRFAVLGRRSSVEMAVDSYFN